MTRLGADADAREHGFGALPGLAAAEPEKGKDLGHLAPDRQ